MPGNNTNQGGFAFAFSGRNAFAFNAQNAFAFGGGPALDAYSFSGMPGNPMLAAGLANSRVAALRAALPAPGTAWGDPAYDGNVHAKAMPGFDSLPEPCRLGTKPRSALALIELLGKIEFLAAADTGTLTLKARGKDNALHDLMLMQCPDLAFFKQQLPLVDVLFTERETRAAEILTQVTPPISYFATVLNLQAGRHTRTLELLDIALQFAYAVCMRFKQAFSCPRPSDLSAAIQPMLEVPPHASFPMGHANEAHVLAGVLSRLALGADGSSMARTALRRIAFRIGENRVVAGLHYPVDGVAGRLLGDTLAGYFLAACGAADAWQSTRFKVDGNGWPVKASYDEGVAECGDSSGTLPAKTPALDAGPAPCPVLRQLWGAAETEWGAPAEGVAKGVAKGAAKKTTKRTTKKAAKKSAP